MILEKLSEGTTIESGKFRAWITWFSGGGVPLAIVLVYKDQPSINVFEYRHALIIQTYINSLYVFVFIESVESRPLLHNRPLF